METGGAGSPQDGDLMIIGRTKDLFKTSKGKYVAPSPIEMKIGACSHIEYCCVVGAGLHQPIALVTLSVTGRQLDEKTLGKEIEIALAELNPTLDAHERIGKIIALPEDWSIDNGLLTPTLKIKRFEIEKRYSDRFVDWLQNTDLFQVEIS